MTELFFTLPWPPTLNTYWRNVNGRVLLSKKGRQYREDVLEIVGFARKPLKGRLAVEICAYPPDKRERDLDNLPKSILDALQHAEVYESDGQIDRLVVERMPKLTEGGATVQIKQLTAKGIAV